MFQDSELNRFEKQIRGVLIISRNPLSGIWSAVTEHVDASVTKQQQVRYLDYGTLNYITPI